jgi:hypothetical protein
MDNIHRHYLVGKNIKRDDLQELQQQHVETRSNKRFLGSDFALANLEALLQNIQNGPMVQIFLIGSNSFPMNVIKHSEAFLRRWPRSKTFFDLAKDGNEASSYSYHKVLDNLHVYIINIYKSHTDTLTICL